MIPAVESNPERKRRPKGTGSVQKIGGRWYASITIPGKEGRPSRRVRYALGAGLSEAAAEARAAAAAERLRNGAEVVPGRVGRKPKSPHVAEGLTVRQFAELWTSGELHRRYPDHVRAKRSVETDEHRLKHVLPRIGGIPIAAFTLEDAERVMRDLPPGLSSASRRHVAQVMHRLLALAVWPCKLRKDNPLPSGWLPKLGPEKAKASLYPDEDARLCAAAGVPLPFRLLWGFMHREGMRSSEAMGLEWSDLDLARGGVRLDENKTDDPRSWALDPSVTDALRCWRKVQADKAGKVALVFTDEEGCPLPSDHLAERFRAHLKAAGVDRPELFENSKARRQIRAHDTRATFVTLALAAGRTETWVSDRTGHKSSDQIARYRRTARTVAELDLGGLRPLVEAIPELRALYVQGRANAHLDAANGAEPDEKKPSKAAVSDASDTAAGVQVPVG